MTSKVIFWQITTFIGLAIFLTNIVQAGRKEITSPSLKEDVIYQDAGSVEINVKPATSRPPQAGCGA